MTTHPGLPGSDWVLICCLTPAVNNNPFSQKCSKFFLRLYLFMRDTERGRDIGRGRISRFPAGGLMGDSIPGLRITP